MAVHLLLALAAAASLVAASPPHTFGIPKSLLSVYTSADGKFKCLDGKGVISTSQVNDEFCDCLDGSDEPGTSACPNGQFYCANKGARGKYIRSSLVNDGICDCCDGSDEHSGRIRCADTCQADGAEWRASLADRIKKAEEGARLREEYARAGASARSQRVGQIAAATTALDAAKAAREAAEQAVQVAEAEEKRISESRTVGPSAVAAGLKIDKWSREQLLELLIQHVRETNTSEALLDTLHARLPADEAEGLAWVDVGEQAAYKSDEGNRAREALTAARGEESKVEREVRAAREDDSTDFGPDDVFYKLKGNCYDLRVNQYTYQACPYGNAKQDSTTLGSFNGWSKTASGALDYSEMSLTNGQMCWNGPNRSLKLQFECGAVDALLSMDEPEKCAYVGRFSTPAVCDAKFARELRLELEADGEPHSVMHSKDEL